MQRDTRLGSSAIIAGDDQRVGIFSVRRGVEHHFETERVVFPRQCLRQGGKILYGEVRVRRIADERNR